MIVLVGFMGGGKTTVGRLLATRLGLPFVDTDDVITTRDGRTVPEIFAADGETAFRDHEEAVIAEVLAGPESVVSLGGGACGRVGTRERLAGHDVVHLRASFAETQRRIGGDPGRPMLARPDLAEIYTARQEVYASVAGRVLDTDGRSAAEIAEFLLAAPVPTHPTEETR
ncbi:shikimate kinase [Kineococcus gynurae]|uniref:Shikimate kinase n=1 Tax=Kineococcus gynurae TaxID=452979 RepID=A0ABV5LQC3_9ACTN